MSDSSGMIQYKYRSCVGYMSIVIYKGRKSLQYFQKTVGGRNRLRSTVVQWVALLLHSKKVLGSNPPEDFSVWSLHVLPMHAWVLSPAASSHHQKHATGLQVDHDCEWEWLFNLCVCLCVWGSEAKQIQEHHVVLEKED